MFGAVSEMINKIKEAQQEIEKTKIRLHSILVEETSADLKIKGTLAANRKIKTIFIEISLLSDAEELEDYLILTLNKAIAKASKINKDKMAIGAKTNLPNIQGMHLFK
jgi:DNA-binding protein YbaB